MPLDAPLTPDGDLPAGLPRATLGEVIARFGSDTPWRRLLGDRLRRLYEVVAGTERLHRFIVFGSFVSSAATPNDVDVFLLMDDGFDASDLGGDAAVVFDHPRAQATLGASVFWMRRLAATTGEDAALEDWQIKRDGTRRGIVELVGDDQK